MYNAKVSPGYGGPQQPGYGAPQPVAPGYQGQPQQPGQPFIVQPLMGFPMQQRQWAAAVPAVAGCPPGLEYLTQIDQLLIKQQIELLEAFTGWETNNKYMVLNNQGQQVYFAAEESDLCQRQFCGAARGFVIHILDNHNQEVMRLSREFKCCAGYCWCATADACSHMVTVEAPVGQVIGYVRQEYSSWAPNFLLKDGSGNPILRIHGPCCVINMPCCEDKFSVWTADDTKDIGEICKQRGLQEFFVDANNFGATFPKDLDVKAKAILLGAVFLLDFMYFEQPANNNRHGGYY